MKKTITLISALLLLFSCKEDTDHTINDILDNVGRGAVLRTVDLISGEFNSFDVNSSFAVTIEEQDVQGGDLLEKVEVWISYNSNSVLLKTIPASAFTGGPHGLPRTTIEVTLTEATSALGVTTAEVGGKSLPIELRLHLTNGEVYGGSTSSGSLQGSFYASPFRYNTVVKCIPDGAVAGDYRINFTDTYGDGFQGSHLVVTIDGVERNYGIPSVYSSGAEFNATLEDYSGGADSGYASFSVPASAQRMSIAFVAGDYPSEVVYEIIYTGSDGQSQSALSEGPNPAEGDKILSICL